MTERARRGGGSSTWMEMTLDTEYETWMGARRALARAGFERMRSDPGADGREEHYSRTYPDQNIMAVMTLTRPVAYAEVHAEVRYVDTRTGKPARMPADGVPEAQSRLAS